MNEKHEPTMDEHDETLSLVIRRARKKPEPVEEPPLRLPPHSHEAEQGVIGCLMLSPGDGIPKAEVAIQPEAFYDLRHRTIYETMLSLQSEGVPADMVTLPQRLRDKDKLDAVGGLSYLLECMNAVPGAANLEFYLAIVAEKGLLRKLLEVCTSIVTDIYNDTSLSPSDILSQAEKNILAIGVGRATKTATTKELVVGAIAEIEKWHNRGGGIGGLETGFPDIDAMLDGLHPSEMTVIGGLPGTGKTTLACQIAMNASLKAGVPTAVFSLEMSAQALVIRLLCCHAKVNARALKRGVFKASDFSSLTLSAGALVGSDMHFAEISDMSISKLRSQARILWKEKGIRLFVVDYLQLLNGGGGKRSAESRQQEVTDVSRGLKAMAMELHVPVLVLSQLNDEGQLRESRTIGQDADNVLRLRPDEKDIEEGLDALPLDLEVLKQRNGPTGKIPLTFLRSQNRFESCSKVSEEDMPTYKTPHSDP